VKTEVQNMDSVFPLALLFNNAGDNTDILLAGNVLCVGNMRYERRPQAACLIFMLLQSTVCY